MGNAAQVAGCFPGSDETIGKRCWVRANGVVAAESETRRIQFHCTTLPPPPINASGDNSSEVKMMSANADAMNPLGEVNFCLRQGGLGDRGGIAPPPPF